MTGSSGNSIPTITDMPVPVRAYPYWTVLYRPETYSPERLPSLSECVKLVEKARVQLRGWDFPHLALHDDTRHGIVRGSQWVGSWANFMGSIEYWQLFQSGQFIHFAAVREATESQWRDKLQTQTMSHLRHLKDIAWDAVPGFISLVNLVYTITEYFEFAARICQAGVYRGNIDISIELHGVKGYMLTTEYDRMWLLHCAATEDHFAKTWRVSTEELLAGSAEHSLKAISWLCECFGWISPSLEALRTDQQKLLSGRL